MCHQDPNEYKSSWHGLLSSVQHGLVFCHWKEVKNTRYLNISSLISEKHFQNRQFLKLFIFFSYSRIPLVKSIWTLRCREPESKFSTISSAFYSGDSQFLVALMSVSLHILSIMSSEAWKSSFEIKITHYFSCHRCCRHPGEDLLHNPGPAWPPEVPGTAWPSPAAQHWVWHHVWWRHRYGHRVVGGYHVDGVHQYSKSSTCYSDKPFNEEHHQIVVWIALISPHSI